MYVMGNDNGPRDYNDFPIGVIPNEIEIVDKTSCTDKEYITLVDGDGIKSVGISDNLSFTEDTLCSPKINTNNLEASVIETNSLKTTINIPTEELPVSLASANGCFADSNLKYNPTTMTLTADNVNIRNVIASCMSVENVQYNNLELNCLNTCSIAPVSDFTGWVSCNERDTVCAFIFGPKAYLSIKADAYKSEVYNAIRSLTNYCTSVAQGVSINQISGTFIGGIGTAHFMKYRSGGQNSYFDFFEYSDWDNVCNCDLCPIFSVDSRGTNTSLGAGMMIELWRR